MRNHVSSGHPSVAVYGMVFIALLVLLVATVAVAYVDLGPLGLPVAIAIASVKAVLIVLIFMHVRYGTPLMWLIAAAGFFWLAIMFSGTLADYMYRRSGEAPVRALPLNLEESRRDDRTDAPQPHGIDGDHAVLMLPSRLGLRIGVTHFG